MTETPVSPAPVPVREKGYDSQGAAHWWAGAVNETTPELVWPRSIEVYDNMRRQDAQVSSVLRAVTYPIMRTAWRLDGTGCRPEVVQHVAGDLGLPIVGEGNEAPGMRGRDRFSWNQHMRLALLMLPFGHMFFEQVYRIDEASGRAHLRKLGPRMPRTIMAVHVARDGGLVSIEQYPTTMTQRIVIPVNRLVAYVLDREGGNWLGQSLLRPAYKNWLLKDRLLRVDAQSIDRNGMGIPVYTGAENETDLSKGQEIASSARSGDNSGAALPYGATLKLQGVEGDLPDALKSVRYHDEQIARAVLAHFLNLGTQTGSWALGSTFADFFTLSLQAVAEEIRDTATSHIVEDLVDLNYGPNEPAPRIVFDEIGSRPDAIVNAIAVLIQNGVLQPDEDLEQFLRTALGLPARASSAPRPTQEAS
jgi:hypothetical protein